MTNKIREAVVALKGDLENARCSKNDTYRLDWTGGGNTFILLTADGGGGWRYFCTKSQFEQEVIKWKQEQLIGGNMEFTKDMLVSGEHIVECNNGVRLLVAGSVLIGVHGFSHLSLYNEDLSHTKGQDDFSIQKVMSYKDISCSGFPQSFVNGIASAHKLPTVWERKEKSLQQLEIEKLQKVIADAKHKIDKLAGANK